MGEALITSRRSAPRTARPTTRCDPFRVECLLGGMNANGCDPFGVKCKVRYPRKLPHCPGCIRAPEPDAEGVTAIRRTPNATTTLKGSQRVLRGGTTKQRVTLDLHPVSMPILIASHDLNRELSGAAGEPIRVIGYRPMSLIGTCRSLGPRARIEYEASRPVRVIKPRSFAQPLKSS